MSDIERIRALLVELRPFIPDLKAVVKRSLCERKGCDDCSGANAALDLVTEVVALNHLQGR